MSYIFVTQCRKGTNTPTDNKIVFVAETLPGYIESDGHSDPAFIAGHRYASENGSGVHGNPLLNISVSHSRVPQVGQIW